MANDEADENVRLPLKYAAENRNSEISLLWTRSAFFWAFLAVAMGAYGAAFHTGHRTLATGLACFAAICSLCWTLANRAGKYWQEVWERKVENLEQGTLSTPIFARITNPPIAESWFWGARQYSPSRLAIAVSDLAVALWTIIAIFTAFWDWHWTTWLRILMLLLGFGYAVSILVWCQSGAIRPAGIRQFGNQMREFLRRGHAFWDRIISN